ncbi:MAG: hypothetical protein AB7R90_17695, partial [Reyranellaceae bacterium]
MGRPVKPGDDGRERVQKIRQGDDRKNPTGHDPARPSHQKKSVMARLDRAIHASTGTLWIGAERLAPPWVARSSRAMTEEKGCKKIRQGDERKNQPVMTRRDRANKKIPSRPGSTGPTKLQREHCGSARSGSH